MITYILIRFDRCRWAMFDNDADANDELVKFYTAHRRELDTQIVQIEVVKRKLGLDGRKHRCTYHTKSHNRIVIDYFGY